MSDFGWRLSSDFRLSDYDQRLSRWSVSDYGWRLSDYDRPPSFRVEVRRFSDLQTGGRACAGAGGAGGGPIAWRVPVAAWRLAAAMFTQNLDFLLRLRLTSKCKYDKLQLPKASKRKFDLKGD